MAKSKLSEYSAKRAFDATPEPAPTVAEGSGPLLFVVQQHSRTAPSLRLSASNATGC
jgi:bifunctional non-homologous end joining protein LigD